MKNEEILRKKNKYSELNESRNTYQVIQEKKASIALNVRKECRGQISDCFLYVYKVRTANEISNKQLKQ